jgi:2-polyprenyl-6-methoxyphenol hydroxylase-like FAD-dependent oxidoreductase
MAATTHAHRYTGTDSSGGGGHAVVIGGSMAGLLAARVLAGHVERVTVVERDALPDGVEQRKGVPQGRQLHVLLPRGRDILDRLFPGFSRELELAGAVPVRVPADVPILTPAGWLDQRAPGWEALSASRPLFEAMVRRRLRRLPGVTVLEGSEVTGLHASQDGRAVDAVAVRRLGSAETTMLEADLVVDASGRGSRAAAWLVELGYPAPEREEVDPDIAYATRVVRMPDGHAADWKGVMLTSQPPTMPRTGYLLPIEDGQWMVAAMGAGGQHPPTDEGGYTAFLRSLRHPIIADAVANAESVTPIRGHRGTANRLWHFERMSRWPDRFLVVGDAVCAFNPVYGQGLSAAAVAAETLDACLLDHRRRHAGSRFEGFAARFQRQLARRIADPWMLSTGEDQRFPTTTGSPTTASTRAMHRYLDRVVLASTRDPRTADTYVHVLGMLVRPSAVFRPRVLAAALRARPDGRQGIPPAPPKTAPAGVGAMA